MNEANYNPNPIPQKGQRRITDIRGRRFNRLIAIRIAGRNKHGQWQWEFRCDCGKVVISVLRPIKIQRTKSCGCWSREITIKTMTKHRLSGTKEYVTWVAMRQRCSNPNHPNFKDYGGRGITVCDRWRSFENFLSDMGQAPPGYSIERKDNEQGYSPDNCCWIRRGAQMNNQRRSHLLTYNGQTLNVSQWARLLHISVTTLQKRLCNRWPVNLALSTPVDRNYSHPRHP